MTLQDLASSTYLGVTRFANLERVLAAFCLFIPVFLIAFDKGPFDDGRIRDSISAYYDMEANQVFYFPLTVTSMLVDSWVAYLNTKNFLKEIFIVHGSHKCVECRSHLR